PTADPTWSRLLDTPPFPEYVSGHSTFSAAASTVLSAFFGANVSFTAHSDKLPSVTRSFTSFDRAAEEAGRSRIFGGIHFQSANLDGQAAGRALGKYVVQNFLLPRSLVVQSPEPNQVTSQNIRIQGRAVDHTVIASLTAQVDGGSRIPVALDTAGKFVFTTALALDGSADGSHTVHLQGLDAKGAPTQSADVSFTLDSTAPTLVLTAPADGAALTAGAQLTGSSAGTGSALQSLTYQIDNGTPVALAADAQAQSFDQPLDLTGLAPGAHQLTVTATDAAGNTVRTTL